MLLSRELDHARWSVLWQSPHHRTSTLPSTCPPALRSLRPRSPWLPRSDPHRTRVFEPHRVALGADALESHGLLVAF